MGIIEYYARAAQRRGMQLATARIDRVFSGAATAERFSYLRSRLTPIGAWHLSQIPTDPAVEVAIVVQRAHEAD